MATKKFTVIGYYEDNGQIFCRWVKAKDSVAAVVAAIKQMRKDEKEENDCALDVGNVAIVSILQGHIRDLNDCPSVCYACDWPGLSKEQQ